MDKELLTRQFTKEQIRKRKGKSNLIYYYVPVETVIERLSQSLDTWNFKVEKYDIIENEGKKEVIVLGTLSTPIGERSAYGCDEVVNSIADSIKTAVSDSIKKASSLFSIPCIIRTVSSHENAIEQQETNQSHSSDLRGDDKVQSNIQNNLCEECDSPISITIKNYSFRNFGKPLCLKCQNKYKIAASR